MSEAAEILRQRLREALDRAGRSPRSVSLAIGANHAYISQILDGRGGMPSAARIRRIAEEVGTTADYLVGTSTTRDPVHSEVRLADPHIEWRGPEAHEPGIPLLGTGDCASLAVEDAQTHRTVHVERSSFDPDFSIRIIARPPALRGVRDLYAIQFVGDSMEPRYYAGEAAIVNPHRPVGRGDYVLVQLNAGDSDEVTTVLAKKLVGQNASEVTLEQYNPPLTFIVPRSRVARIHRILPQTDLLFG